MKTCAVCGIELPTPLDEFGPAGNEVCQSDFLAGALEDAISKGGDEEIDIDQEIEDADERLNEIEAEIEDLVDERFDLQMKLRNLHEMEKEREHPAKTVSEPIDFSKYPLFSGMSR